MQQHVKSDTSAPLSDEKIERVQDIVSTFFWYSRACDPTLAASLSAIVSLQTNGTEDGMPAWHQLLDYIATHPNVAIWYHASDMILAFNTDASYISELCGKICATAYYYVSNNGQKDFNNGAIDVLSTIIKHVMSSA